MKKFSWVLLSFFLLAPSLVSAFSFDGYLRDTSTCNGSTSCSISYTVVTADLLVVEFYDPTHNVPTACQYNGVSLTIAGSAGGDGSIEGLYLLNPPAGSHTLTCTAASAFSGSIVNIASYETGGYTYVSNDANNTTAGNPWTYTFTGTATSFGVMGVRNNEDTFASVSGMTSRSTLPLNAILVDSNGNTSAGTNSWVFTPSSHTTIDYLYDFMLFDQGSSPPAPTSSAATSTLDQSERNLSTAFFIFFIGMFGTIWLLRRK